MTTILPELRGKVITTSTDLLDNEQVIIQHNEYDDCGRLDFITKNNHLQSAIMDSVIYTYDAADNIVKERTRIVDQNNLSTIAENLTYFDDDGRVSAEWIELDGNLQQLCEPTYDEKDLVQTKYIGGDNVSHLQKVDYSYLDNQMLHKVNGGVAMGDDLFGYTLNYHQIPILSNTSAGTITPRMNGDISSIEWQQNGKAGQLYIYNYDYLNRLTHSYTNSDLYNTSYTYGARGNFESIQRYADINGLSTLIDNMIPSYKSDNKNQMELMVDHAMDDKGYKSVDDTQKYTYDGNGNMTRDPQKGITMTYNHLDLTEEIIWDDGRKLEMSYDAHGSLISRKTIDKNGTEIQAYDFLGALEYLNSYRYVIHHSEGRIVNVGLEPYLNYLYLDHQQSTDASFNAKMIESTGLVMDETTIYDASSVIELHPGFEVTTNAEFIAGHRTSPSLSGRLAVSLGYQRPPG